MSDVNLPTVSNNAAAGQFEMHTEAGNALLRYVFKGETMDLVHTEVPATLEGKGYGSALAKAALDHARAEQLKVIPSCAFVRAYLRRHPQYADLVSTE